MSRLVVAAVFVLGMAVGVLAVGFVQAQGHWHRVTDTCALGTVVSYSGASEGGEIVFKGPDGCTQVWKR